MTDPLSYENHQVQEFEFKKTFFLPLLLTQVPVILFSMDVLLLQLYWSYGTILRHHNKLNSLMLKGKQHGCNILAQVEIQRVQKASIQASKLNYPYIMEAKGLNQTIWHKQIELRDDGRLSMITIIWILAPRPVQNLMTNNMLLLLRHYPIFMMQDPPSFLIQDTHNQFNKCIISPTKNSLAFKQ